jgi:tocopherol O-methyltransferase
LSTHRNRGLRSSIESHYDSLLFLYRSFWGEHIHHGLWSGADETPALAQECLVSHLAQTAAIQRGARVLDVGCGYGAPARWLARNLDCRISGITISGRQARLALRLAKRAHLDNAITVVRGDAAELPFGTQRFEVIWVIECIEHLADKHAFVREAVRLLAPGGRLALCSWLRGEGVRADDETVRNVCDAFLCPSLATASEYCQYCIEAGLQVDRFEDLTARVRPTWKILIRRVERPWWAPLRLLVGAETRRFVDGFRTIDEAYEQGKMRYGLLVASRHQGSPR